MTDDRHRRHELRCAHTVLRTHNTVPAALQLEVRPGPTAWQRPSPRAGCQLPIAYHRDRHTLRAVCRWVPVLIPLARWLA